MTGLGINCKGMHLHNFSPLLKRKTTFITPCLPPLTKKPLQKKKLSSSLSQKLKCFSSMGGSEDILSTSTSSHSESSTLIFFGVLVNGVTGLFLTLKGLLNGFWAFVDFFEGV